MIFTLSAAICLSLFAETYDASDSRKLLRSAEGELVAFWRAERGGAGKGGRSDAYADRRTKAESSSPLLGHTVTVRVRFERHYQQDNGTTAIIGTLAGNMDQHVNDSDLPNDIRREIQLLEQLDQSPSVTLNEKQIEEQRRGRREIITRMRRDYLERAGRMTNYVWIEMPLKYVPPTRPDRRFEALVLVQSAEYILPLHHPGDAVPFPDTQEFPYLVVRAALVRSDDLGWQASGAIK